MNYYQTGIHNDGLDESNTRKELLFEKPELLKRFLDNLAYYPALSTEEILETCYTGKLRSHHKSVQISKWESLKGFINNSVCRVEISDELPGEINAVYLPERDVVLINQEASLQQLVREIAQEMAHAALDEKIGRYSRQKNAFTAYCISYAICARIGVSAELFVFENVPESLKARSSEEIGVFLDTVREKTNLIASPLRDRQKERHHDEAR